MAVHYPSVGNYLDMGSSATLAPANISVSFWVKTDGAAVQFNGLMGNTNGAAWTAGWGFFFNSATEVRFFIEHFNNNVAISGAMTPTNWNHIVGTWDGATVRIYVNGVEGTSDAYAGAMTTGNTLFVGILGAAIYSLPCIQDDVRLYNRALSAAEVSTIYAEGGADGIVYGLTDHWRIDEKQAGASVTGANSVVDLGTGGNPGSPVGTPSYNESVLRKRKRVA